MVLSPEWLTAADVLASDEAAVELVTSGASAQLCFPSDWPRVFSTSKPLRALVNGTLRGVRCRAVAVDASGEREPASSFQRAAQLAASSDATLVKGFVVYELADGPRGCAFVAIRRWWNAAPGGAWFDAARPLVPGGRQLLLVESPLGERGEAAGRAGLGGGSFEAALRERLAGRPAEGVEAAIVRAEIAPPPPGEAGDEAAAGTGGSGGGAAAQIADGVALFARGLVGGAKGCFERAAVARLAEAEEGKERGNEAFRDGDGEVPPQPYAFHYEVGVADAKGDAATAEFARILRLRAPKRRPSNSPRLFLDTLQTSWGFRHSPRVRRALARLIAWLYRCPVAKGRFSHFPADNMKPIQQRVQRCAWLVQGEWTVPSASHADYERETGLTIGDGPVEDA
ncbi:hypothetical protein EMIHUDRAFT_243177 [Emiliania huxleyi CCMP1516]|uniref:Uncharacterized protein n=2 Tax=Emiliania huxleyi TaxID=2903 RepID=A0A0D3J6N9_EMIH1|nr:hypothetical protein EMIHUDRAFT_243177 [Emiliania huxleyi CCMP1516]EOD19174.1 hypothetical protein EMIHUDRAFT_243177 [Emiliania huxleyi CCMP1516]|eukprot:XP_005771603.1 hypothetical protein EMIHUDRAFT_243177 [Emiliania huxleyi CCMP1516]